MTKGYDFTDLANIATRNITYNADNMPKKVVHTRYGTTNITYDAAGGRAKKVSPSGTTYYIGEHFEKINGETIKYIFAGDMRIAKITASSTCYFHKDHLGSSTLMTDSSGNVVETTEYMPFGEMRAHTGSTVTNYKYTDQELDPETGLYYYGARYYDPVIGRFISPDSIVQNPFDPQMLNRYSYCRNNPLIYTDPNGQFFGIDDIIIGAIVGAIIGGAASAVTGGDILKGMAMGAIGGAFLGAAAGYGFVAEVAAGAVGGGVNAAIFGGDIGQGIMYGAIGAAVGYGIGQLSGLGNANFKFATQVIGGGITSGTIAELTGGNFGQGFTAGAIGAAAGYGMGKLVQYIENLNTAKGIATDELAGKKAGEALTIAEWQEANTVEVALGPFGPGFTNVRPTDSYAFDFDAIPTDPAIEWMMQPIHGARPGVFAGAGLQGLYGGYKTGNYLYRGISPAFKHPVPILPNPNILKPPAPQLLPGRMRIR